MGVRGGRTAAFRLPPSAFPLRFSPQTSRVGSRQFLVGTPYKDYTAKVVRYYLKRNHVIVTGCCGRGIDKVVRDTCIEEGTTAVVKKAKWDELGKKAGMLRNSVVVKDCDQLHAIWNGGKSNGTFDAAGKADKAGKLDAVHCLRVDEITVFRGLGAIRRSKAYAQACRAPDPKVMYAVVASKGGGKKGPHPDLSEILKYTGTRGDRIIRLEKVSEYREPATAVLYKWSARRNKWVS